MSEVPESIAEILRETYFAYFCTADGENQPHITPMFFSFDPQTHRFYFITSIHSKKIANIRKNPYVSFTIDIRDDVDPLNNRGVMIQGKAKFTHAKDAGKIRGALTTQDLEKIHNGFMNNYPKVKLLGDLRSIDPKEAIVEVSPEKMVYWRGPRFTVMTRFPEKKEKQKNWNTK